MERIIFLGPPASGKGTQSQILADRLGLPNLSTGALLRKHITEGSEIGSLAKPFMDEGQYIPDELAIRMTWEWVCLNSEGWVLDGFPRTLEQAKKLDALLTDSVKVIYLDVSLDQLQSRILSRLQCHQCGAVSSNGIHEKGSPCHRCKSGKLLSREDDNEEKFKNRYEFYQRLSEPLIDYYQSSGRLISIPSASSSEEISKLIFQSIQYGKAQI